MTPSSNDGYKYHIHQVSFTVVNGENCLSFVNRITTNNLSEFTDLQRNQTLVCDPNGKIIDYFELVPTRGQLILIGLKNEGSFSRELLVNSKGWKDKIEFYNGDDNLSMITIFDDKLLPLSEIFNKEIADIELCRWIENDSMMISTRNSKSHSLDIILQSSMVNEFIGTINKANGAEATKADWDIFRWQNSIIDGIDLRNNPLPSECGLGELVDLKKGCYPGQEIHARLESRGVQKKQICK